ncbi:MAG: hypothetical protein GY870_12210 [archaeon]|nr:hypothetical protein [archaeon]
MEINDIIVIFFIILRFIVGIVLVNRANKKGLTNLYYLAIQLLVQCIGYLFYTSFFNNIFMFNVFMTTLFIPFIIFVDKTFYQGKKSPFKIMLVAVIVLTILTCVLIGIYQFGPTQDLNIFFLGRITYSIEMGITALWMVYSAADSYIKIKSKEDVEPWIKARYLLVMLYMSSSFGIALVWPFFPYDMTITLPYLIGAIFLVILNFGQFFAWVMPEGFKKWLNRNYKPDDTKEDLSEEEIMKSFEEG